VIISCRLCLSVCAQDISKNQDHFFPCFQNAVVEFIAGYLANFSAVTDDDHNDSDDGHEEEEREQQDGHLLTFSGAGRGLKFELLSTFLLPSPTKLRRYC